MSQNINTKPNIIQQSYLPVFKGAENDASKPDLNIEAHYSTNMKVKPPRLTVNDIPSKIPTHQVFSPQEADNKLKQINTDIFVNAKKEASNRDFDTKLYFKIFGGVVLTTAIISCLRKFGK